MTDSFGRLPEIAGDLFVGAQMRRRSDHDRGGSCVHRASRQRSHRGEARRGYADDDLLVLRPLDEAGRDLDRLIALELRRFAENA